MRHALATAGKVALGGLIILAFAALAVVGANMGMRLGGGLLRSATPAAVAPPGTEAGDARVESSEAGSPDVPPADASPADAPPADAAPTATPAEVLAERFPADDAASQPSTFSVASVIPGEASDAFDLGAVSGLATIEPPWPEADRTAPAGTTADIPPPAQPDPAKSEPAKPGGPLSRRLSARSPNVFNEAMLTSIRQRLRLTAEQQKLWPPVEAALRKIVYTRAGMTAPRGGGTAYIDPAGSEIQELKVAALPLIMHLNAEQKREVRDLVHVMGLEALASQF